ncbi:MAG: transporter substrate-binding domain-containing protein [Erysipelotrichaceae bacterium]|nr:transporter substrate-binding domain-containing protein [Erysipelotrichaceae bacterium]
MKKIITLLSILMLTMLCGCSNSNTDLLTEIQNRGYMVVASEGEWMPWTYHDETTDELVGFDVELSKLVAEKLGVEARCEEAQWDSLLAGAKSGRYDMVFNGVDYSDERAESYNFTDGYVFTTSVLVVMTDNTDITSFDDLKGKTTTNSIGSIYETIATDYGATVVTGDTFADTIMIMGRGDADATINSAETVGAYLKEVPDAPIKIVDQTEGNAICGITRKDASTESFVDAVNEALNELRDSGELSALSIKYFGLDITNN